MNLDYKQLCRNMLTDSDKANRATHAVKIMALANHMTRAFQVSLQDVTQVLATLRTPRSRKNQKTL